MPFEFIDHTGDIAVRLRAPTLAALFEEAALAFTSALTEPAHVARRDTLSISLTSSELDLLLVDWLSELLYLFESRRLLVAATRVSVVSNGGYRLHAEVTGDAPDPARHPLKILIKAVTYHGLHVTHGADGWQATVIFDI